MSRRYPRSRHRDLGQGMSRAYSELARTKKRRICGRVLKLLICYQKCSFLQEILARFNTFRILPDILSRFQILFWRRRDSFRNRTKYKAELCATRRKLPNVLTIPNGGRYNAKDSLCSLRNPLQTLWLKMM